MDLAAESRRALEFDELLTWVATFSCTAPGGRSVLGRRPSADLGRVQAELSLVAEARRCLARTGRLVPRGLPDPDPALVPLAVGGAVLEPKLLRSLAVVLHAVADLRRRLGHAELAEFDLLREAGQGLADFTRECAAVLRGIDSEGGITDDASAELRRIRQAIAAAGERLRRALLAHLRDPAAGSAIRDDFVTERNGRFVIPWRTDAPHPPAGIVHAASSSGATLFVEPLSTIELNNDRVRLADAEREECERLLAVWSESFRSREHEVESSLEALARLDDLQARALYADEVDAVVPNVSEAGPLRLRAARHPLLERKLKSVGLRPVPADLALDPADQVLVVSGPNTGGKTVVIKTLGLAVLAAQAGLPVPAAEADLPLYGLVRADIGDRQSIEADLSTYSAHLQAVAGFLACTARPALFLFDEIGTGTEPGEGAALARSILEALRGNGITAVATTHLGSLKSWAMTQEGVVSAAMEFDEVSLRPTYRLSMGLAGVSAGLQIAERLGLAPAIVTRARALLDPLALESENYLQRLRTLVADAEQRRGELERRQVEIEEQLAEAEAQARKELEVRRQETRLALERSLAELRGEAKLALASIADDAAQTRAKKKWTKAEAGLLAAATRSLQDDAELAPAEDGVERPWGPGSTVFVLPLGRQGQVVEIDGDRVAVRLGSVVTTVARSEVRGAASSPPSKPTRMALAPMAPMAPMAPSRSPSPELGVSPRELMLIGFRAEEALTTLDRFLDAAVLAGLEEVRIVHGHGTGRLRTAVRRFLDEHAHAAAWRPGTDGEGGDGATVVRLA